MDFKKKFECKKNRSNESLRFTAKEMWISQNVCCSEEKNWGCNVA